MTFFKSKSDSDDTGFINNQPVILQHHMYTHPVNKIFYHCYAILCKINFWMKLYSVQLAWFILNAYKELTHVVRIELNFSLVTSLCYGRFCWSQENQTSKLMTLLQKQIQCTIIVGSVQPYCVTLVCLWSCDCLLWWSGLSSRARGWGFPLDTMSVVPGYFYWKMEEK